MTGSILYTDATLTSAVTGNILFEGETYYLQLTDYSATAIRHWITAQFMQSALRQYVPGNAVTAIRFDNQVGMVDILGRQYDVRSTKLRDNESGNAQFQALLDEVASMAGNLTFQFVTPSFARPHTTNGYNWDLLRMLDYYYQLVFDLPAGKHLDALLQQCFKAPHAKNELYCQSVGVDKVNRVHPDFAKRLGRRGGFTPVPDGNPLAKITLVRNIAARFTKQLVPAEVDAVRFRISHDTNENRFVLFFLKEIQSCCLQVLHARQLNEAKDKAQRLHDAVFRQLQHPFFQGIGRLTYLPVSSSVLLKKAGYRELYTHYVQSKRSVTPILENLNKTAHNTRLKNIAALYEVWAFYKIASVFFTGKVVQVSLLEQTRKHGMVLDAWECSAAGMKLYYNKGFSRKNGASYSLPLRPDVTLVLPDGRTYFFDAKYKFREIAEETIDDDDTLTPSQRTFKREDIHKMHTYLDAIPHAQASIVLYPGTEFTFYDRSGTIHRAPFELTIAEGVGAIPLLPGTDDQLTSMLKALLPPV